MCWNGKAVPLKDMIRSPRELTTAWGRWDDIPQSEAHVSRAPSEASASGRHDHPQCFAPVPKTCVVRCDSIAYLLNKRTNICNKEMKSPSFRKVKREENARRKEMEDSHSKSLNQEFQVLNYPPNTVEGIWVRHKENGWNSQQWKKSFLMQREGKWSISHVSYWYS